MRPTHHWSQHALMCEWNGGFFSPQTNFPITAWSTQLLFPVGRLNIWFTAGWTLKGKILQRPPPPSFFFPGVNHAIATTWWFISQLQKKIKNQTHNFLKGQTVYIHLQQGSIGHQSQTVSEKTLNEGSQSTALPVRVHRSIKNKWLEVYCIW